MKSDSPEEALVNSIRAYLRNLDEMKKGEVPLGDLVVRRRVKKIVADYKVQNLTFQH